MEGKNNNIVTGVVAVIVGVVIGGLVGYSAGGMNKDDTHTDVETQSATIDTDAANTRVALNNSLREHVSLSAAALRAAFDGDPNTEALLATLDENSVEVAGVVGSVYGKEAEQSFLSLWRNHIGFFADYTTAAKTGDKAGMKKALDDLAGYGKDAAAFFEAANPNLPASVVMPALEMHRDQVIAAVNAWGAKDYTESYKQEQIAREHMNVIGDALAGGIVKQQNENS